MIHWTKPGPGDLVTIEQIAHYAQPGCGDCGGGGFKNPGERVDGNLCECARDRFLDQNIFRLWPDDTGDCLRWGPNPPTSDELKKVGKITGAWAQFTDLVKSDRKSDA